jgi:sigma-B regulation protein RsbU (phosphoserine phosphatase)
MTPPRDQDDAKAAEKPAQAVATQSFEGDYRPSSETPLAAPTARVDPLQSEFLMRLANTLNTTLDLQTLMHRTADLVRAVIDYRIFAILLLNAWARESWGGPRNSANPFCCRT